MCKCLLWGDGARDLLLHRSNLTAVDTKLIFNPLILRRSIEGHGLSIGKGFPAKDFRPKNSGQGFLTNKFRPRNLANKFRPRNLANEFRPRNLANYWWPTKGLCLRSPGTCVLTIRYSIGGLYSDKDIDTQGALFMATDNWLDGLNNVLVKTLGQELSGKAKYQ
jgi:hypothetical protein